MEIYRFKYLCYISQRTERNDLMKRLKSLKNKNKPTTNPAYDKK